MLTTIFLKHPYNPQLPTAKPAHLACLAKLLPATEIVSCGNEDDLLAVLPDTAVLVSWFFRQEWFGPAGKLRWLATPAAGRDLFRVTPPREVEITYGSFHGELMSETVLAMMLAFSRGIHRALILQESDPWARAEVMAGMRPIRGGRAVILGFGNIGRWIGRILKPLAMRITGIARHNLARPDYFDNEDMVVPLERLDEALPEAEHMILSLPGGEETDRIMDARRLFLLPRGGFIYNVGRGNAIDEEALAAALRENRLAGAGLDVYAAEPLPADSPLRKCPNAILMPHVSAMSSNYLDLFFREFSMMFNSRLPCLAE